MQIYSDIYLLIIFFTICTEINQLFYFIYSYAIEFELLSAMLRLYQTIHPVLHAVQLLTLYLLIIILIFSILLTYVLTGRSVVL